jgi:ATP-dependent protease ClpP protease subunit
MIDIRPPFMPLPKRPRWFEITALAAAPLMLSSEPKTGRVGQLTLRGYIGKSEVGMWDEDCCCYEEGGAGTVKEFEARLGWLGPVDELQILVSSEGGNYFDALVMADMVLRLKVPVVGIVEGYAFSSAVAFLAKCCKEIRMSDNAWQMIHNPEGATCGDFRDVMAYGKMLDQAAGNYANILASRGKTTAEEFRKLMDEETFLDGAECAALGLADVLTDEVALTAVGPMSPGAVYNTKKLPPQLVALFDTARAAESKPSKSSPEPDMTPEEVQAIIDKSTKPLITANEDLTKKLGTMETDMASRITAAVEPFKAENETLKTRLEAAEKLLTGGPAAAVTASGPAVSAAAVKQPGETNRPDVTKMTAAQAIAFGRQTVKPTLGTVEENAA